MPKVKRRVLRKHTGPLKEGNKNSRYAKPGTREEIALENRRTSNREWYRANKETQREISRLAKKKRRDDPKLAKIDKARRKKYYQEKKNNKFFKLCRQTSMKKFLDSLATDEEKLEKHRASRRKAMKKFRAKGKPAKQSLKAPAVEAEKIVEEVVEEVDESNS